MSLLSFSLHTEWDGKEKSETRDLTEDIILQRTCQNMPSCLGCREWPELLLVFSMWLQVQMRDKCDQWEQLTADRRQTWSQYDPNVVVLL